MSPNSLRMVAEPWLLLHVVLRVAFAIALVVTTALWWNRQSIVGILYWNRRQITAVVQWDRQPTGTADKWERLVTKTQRIRRLQRIYHNTGIHLQEYPRSILTRLTKQHLAAERAR